jgi:hypothetical protein
MTVGHSVPFLVAYAQNPERSPGTDDLTSEDPLPPTAWGTAPTPYACTAAFKAEYRPAAKPKRRPRLTWPIASL